MYAKLPAATGRSIPPTILEGKLVLVNQCRCKGWCQTSLLGSNALPYISIAHSPERAKGLMTYIIESLIANAGNKIPWPSSLLIARNSSFLLQELEVSVQWSVEQHIFIPACCWLCHDAEALWKDTFWPVHSWFVGCFDTEILVIHVHVHHPPASNLQKLKHIQWQLHQGSKMPLQALVHFVRDTGQLQTKLSREGKRITIQCMSGVRSRVCSKDRCLEHLESVIALTMANPTRSSLIR